MAAMASMKRGRIQNLCGPRYDKRSSPLVIFIIEVALTNVAVCRESKWLVDTYY